LAGSVRPVRFFKVYVSFDFVYMHIVMPVLYVHSNMFEQY